MIVRGSCGLKTGHAYSSKDLLPEGMETAGRTGWRLVEASGSCPWLLTLLQAAASSHRDSKLSLCSDRCQQEQEQKHLAS